MNNDYPPEAMALIKIAQLLKQNMISVQMSRTTVTDHGISDETLDQEQYISRQDIIIADQELYAKCTSAEWHVIGRITYDLKMSNALWKCPDDLKKSSSARKAIKGLLDKNIIAKTKATQIYVVNPTAIRRGKDWKVALSTAQAIYDNNGVDESLIKNLKPITAFNFLRSGETTIQQIGYGYVDDAG